MSFPPLPRGSGFPPNPQTSPPRMQLCSVFGHTTRLLPLSLAYRAFAASGEYFSSTISAVIYSAYSCEYTIFGLLPLFFVFSSVSI